MCHVKPRRSTDLDLNDITCLIKLCDTRLHTINLHIKKHSFSDNASFMKAAIQIEIARDKLKKKLTERGG